MPELMPEENSTLCYHCKWLDVVTEEEPTCGKYRNPEAQCSLSIVEKVVFDPETLFTMLPYASSLEILKASRIPHCE
jgi:hypothetical protein